MSYSFFNLSEPLMNSIGMALLHTLWQAAAIAVVIYLLLRLMTKFSSLSRYYLASSGLVLVALLPIIAIWRSFNQEATPLAENVANANSELVNVIYVLADASFGFDHIMAQATNFFNQLSTYFVWFWLFGMLLMIFRLSGGYLLAYRFKTRHIRQVDSRFANLTDRLASKLNISRKVKLFESFKVDVPMVIGFFKPAIIVPVGLFGRLPFEQVEMILAHELAHIKRADFAVNLLQSLVEVLLFFNPFVWWLSSIIRQERENICDDMAISITGENINLARALVSLSETPQSIAENSLALYFNKFNTMKRIERLFSNPRLKPSNIEKLIVSLMAMLAVVVLTSTGSMAGVSITGIYDAGGSPGPLTESYINNKVPDSLKPVSSEERTMKKEILIELTDGVITKAVIDGNEVPTDELEKEGFAIIEKDTAIMKRVEIRGVHPKFKTMVLETNNLEWHQKSGDSTTKRKIVMNPMNHTFEMGPADAGKNVYRFHGADGNFFGVDGRWYDSLMMRIPQLDSLHYTRIYERLPQALFKFDSTFNFYFNTTMDSVVKLHKLPSAEHFPFHNKMVFEHLDDGSMHFISADQVRNQVSMEMELHRMEAEARQMKAGADQDAMMHEIELKRQQLDDSRKEMEQMRMEMEKANRERSMVFMKSFPDNREFEFVMERDRPRETHGFERRYLQLFKEELIAEGRAKRGSFVVVTSKQSIIDGQVVDGRSHKQMVKRLEEISGKKLGKDQAVTIR
jgi:beta-lactamase regulating signal transducer with metallopeptidase domain